MILEDLLKKDQPLAFELAVVALVEPSQGNVFGRYRKKFTALRERTLRQTYVFGLFTSGFQEAGDFVLFNPLKEAPQPREDQLSDLRLAAHPLDDRPGNLAQIFEIIDPERRIGLALIIVFRSFKRVLSTRVHTAQLEHPFLTDKSRPQIMLVLRIYEHNGRNVASKVPVIFKVPP